MHTPTWTSHSPLLEPTVRYKERIRSNNYYWNHLVLSLLVILLQWFGVYSYIVNAACVCMCLYVYVSCICYVRMCHHIHFMYVYACVCLTYIVKKHSINHLNQAARWMSDSVQSWASWHGPNNVVCLCTCCVAYGRLLSDSLSAMRTARRNLNSVCTLPATMRSWVFCHSLTVAMSVEA